MKAVPLSYSYRNLWARKTTTLLTVLGIALVVFVFAAVLMLAYGLEETLVSTGSDSNYVVIRKSSQSDILSMVNRESAALIKTFPEIEKVEGNKALASTEVAVIINLQKYKNNDMGNVIVRGVSPEVLQLRPQVRMREGRMFRTGTTEVMAGRSISERFQGCRIGDTVRFGNRNWTIVGVFDAEKSGFESEIWGDVEQMMTAFGRPVYSIMTLRMQNPSAVSAFRARFESEQRLQQLEVKNEKKYFAQQSEMMSAFIRYLGMFITIIFSFGAMIGAMITMYSAVANRTVEVGTLRALGFQRRNILLAFLMEAMFLSLLGAAIGLVLAGFLQAVTISTVNFTTFTELAFGFKLSPSILVYSLLFSVIMGIIGGFLPAVRASRLNIVNALRAS